MELRLYFSLYVFIPHAGRTSSDVHKLKMNFRACNFLMRRPITGILTNPHSHSRENFERHSMYVSYLIWKNALSFPVAKKYPCFTTPESPDSLQTTSTCVSVDDRGEAERRVSRSLTHITELIK